MIHESDAILVMNCPTALASSTAVAEAILATIEKRKQTGKPSKPVLTNWLGDGASRDARALFAARGIASFDHAVRGDRRLHAARAPRPRPGRADAHAAFAARGSRLRHRGGAPNARRRCWQRAARCCRRSKPRPCSPPTASRSSRPTWRTPRGGRHDSPHAGIADHGACVVKVLSDDLSHKSDVGGVRLGLEHAAGGRQAAEDILERVARLKPEARVKGFTVQPMIRRPQAIELIAGMSVDATFGPLLMFGAGGTAVEVVRDTAHALPPLDLNLAHDLMRQTRVWQPAAGLPRPCRRPMSGRSPRCWCGSATSSPATPRSASSTLTRCSPTRAA